MGLENIDTDLWKEIQDKFSERIGLGIITVDLDGKELAVSGNLPFYSQLIRSKNIKLYHKTNGLVNIKKPVVLYGEEVGSIICGPVGVDVEFDFRDLAHDLGIETGELIDAANDVKKLPKEEVELYSKFISLLAELVPKLTHQTKKKDKEIMELKTLYNIIQKVNSSLELKEVLKYIMNFLVRSLNATDCSVFVYDEDSERKFTLKEAEKMTEIEKQVASKALEEKKPIIVKDVGERFNQEIDENYNAMLVLPLKHRDNIIGTISLYDKEVDLKEEDMDFISVIADQMAIAIANAKQFGDVKELAVVDKLTGFFNRRHFTDLLEKNLEEDITVENPIALILLDIDNFGNYNNTHGHPKGDELLKEISKVIRKNIREEDSVGRYGGEEFIILLPKASPAKALEIAENIKNSIAEYGFYGRESQLGGKVTVSVGLVCCRANVPSSELIKDADDSLYKAKNSGKNKVVQKVILADGLKTEV